jgi:DNA-binding NarL/FixJ family response regulator
MRAAICTLLLNREHGIAICGEAVDYGDLLGKLPELQPDVVLMDVHMPGTNLPDVATIREQLKSVCLIAMSFANDSETKKLAAGYGAAILLDKVNLASELVPAVHECLRQRRQSAHA